MAIVHDFELDVRGEACPYPLIRTKQQVDRLQKGEVLKVLASDPVAPQNIDAWAKKSGNELLAVEVDGGTYNIFVRKG
ncbi:MAG: sulfurtransferase TusA family protein [Euryarchaeota archaeon]|nr:sulfurtransferase TusA family protein [Euryarchaeota archaeon]MCG2737118.1 sulfurtransferase TusA family protein [Candidatus Methanoperedenaceae archaeon]